ncbi:hypothetical protein [Brucella pituitosa]|uniref:hypothetical protein n=1 Tax=Brucella pituitosa TaxID=571256 RepID=UPI003F4A9F19
MKAERHLKRLISKFRRWRKIIAAMAAVSLVSACQTEIGSNIKPVEPVTPYQLTKLDAFAIFTGVQEKLKDPGSANFGETIAAIDGNGVISVCGTVNARNSFGGYTGSVPYHGVLGTNNRGERVFAMIGIGASPSDSSTQAILLLCKRLKIVR